MGGAYPDPQIIHTKGFMGLKISCFYLFYCFSILTKSLYRSHIPGVRDSFKLVQCSVLELVKLCISNSL